ncbi:DHBP synthase RibB-like alpha/beta domain-containing protein [Rhodofomes roseus]|uniref:3,4-dihydroxy-2-butanone-4-phosphate synthase n=1 Tax=Rhodofomes roseus TaxID=34475 RepID=A0ABQ8KWT1_9APHY|nr:DHBP synthase RibB-like alpha/beta domain-containing protein [Rhodofomes roseus]KAH9842994.1 DHBP synthase RibB-like alpha/beta domain-containing protein [Rhodofomes roseus]
MEGDSQPAPKLPRHSARPQAVDAPARAEFAFDGMEEALDAFGHGEFVVMMDDEGRENEGDLIIAASEGSTEKMAWMIKHTSGYICIALPGEWLDELAILMMVSDNQDPHRTAYSHSRLQTRCAHPSSSLAADRRLPHLPATPVAHPSCASSSCIPHRVASPVRTAPAFGLHASR